MDFFTNLFWTIIYALHIPALVIGHLGTFLAGFIGHCYNCSIRTDIFVTWAIYLLIFWFIFKNLSSFKRRCIFSVLFIIYILLMIILVEGIIASGLNLTIPVPTYSLQ